MLQILLGFNINSQGNRTDLTANFALNPVLTSGTFHPALQHQVAALAESR